MYRTNVTRIVVQLSTVAIRNSTSFAKTPERLLRPRSMFRRETDKTGGETRPRTDLRTRCRGRCRGVSRDSVYIVLRDRETPDRQSAQSDLWGVSRGREDEKIPLSPRAFFVIHAFVALFRDFGGTTQIRRTLFQEGQAIEINILPRFILSHCPRCYSLLFVANSEYIRCG